MFLVPLFFPMDAVRLDQRFDTWYIIGMYMHATISTREELEHHLVLTEDESRWFEANGDTLPLLISTYYLSLMNPGDPDDPIRRQVVPSIREMDRIGLEQMDPLAEISHSVLPRLIHRYRNRVAFLVTDRCATYCRHCFRRRFTATECSHVSESELDAVAAYVHDHAEVREMLLTGGDPLTLSDERLMQVITAIRNARPDLVLRLCSRMPATFPQRITDDLIARLKPHTCSALYLMTQFNHPREITRQSVQAVARFIDAGIPVMNQTVLLRGVNDDASVLEHLMNLLVANRVKPYYLFQGDLVSGTAHLRVPLEKGLELESVLRSRLSGLAMPQYAIDLPEGGGKVPLGRSYLEGKDESGTWMFRTVSGEPRNYSDPD